MHQRERRCCPQCPHRACTQIPLSATHTPGILPLGSKRRAAVQNFPEIKNRQNEGDDVLLLSLWMASLQPGVICTCECGCLLRSNVSPPEKPISVHEQAAWGASWHPGCEASITPTSKPSRNLQCSFIVSALCLAASPKGIPPRHTLLLLRLPIQKSVPRSLRAEAVGGTKPLPRYESNLVHVFKNPTLFLLQSPQHTPLRNNLPPLHPQGLCQ